MNSLAKIFVFTFIFILSGCATNDRQRTEMEGLALGCGVGAALGNLIGKDRKSTAIGCAAGSIAGVTYGKHVADEKEKYASKEEHFKAVIVNAKKVSSDARAFNRQLTADISEVKNELAMLKKSSANLASKNTQLTNQQKKTKALLSEARKKLNQLKTEIQTQRKFLANNAQNIDPNLIEASQKEISQLEAENKALQIALIELQTIDTRRAY